MCRLHVNIANFVSFFSKNCLSLLLVFLLGVRANDEELTTLFLETVAGMKVTIPCNMTPSVIGDSNTLVLWYKDDSETPFYSLDNRTDGVGLEPQHFVTDHVQSRAYFNMASSIPRLEITDVRASDAGLYRCRVDFIKSRTVNYQSKLNVIVPPEVPVIRNENGDTLKGLIGPYNEGDSLFLVCEVRQGNPRPSLKWWRGPELMKGKYTETTGGLIRNDLIIVKLTRDRYKMNLTCSASNNNLTQPPSADVTINMNFKPKTVQISKGRKPMSTKKMNEVVCTSKGSVPPAKITWWKGTKKMKSAKYYVSDDGTGHVGDVTATSILQFKPTSRDDGAYLTCRVQNPDIDGSAIEDGFKIQVHYAPQVTLTVQSGLDGSIVEEGSDVFFSCSILAQPSVDKIQWFFNGHPLTQNHSQGNIVISMESLHLHNVQRIHSGHYSCMGQNKQGEGVSNVVTLRVKYAPVCKENQTVIYGISMHEVATVMCEVDADPPYVDFKWKFNNSKEEFKIIDATHKDMVSWTKYTPRTNKDYGFLFCTATNKIGEQKQPCVYALVFAAPPEPLVNCSVVNRTTDTVQVWCSAGDDGGLQQMFVMEVYDKYSHNLLANISSDQEPKFTATDLPPNKTFLLIIYSSNNKGRSHTRTLAAHTTKFTQKQTSAEHQELFIFNPIIGILIGVVASLVLVAIIIVVSMKIIAMKSRNHKKSNADQIKTHIPFQTTIIDQDFQQYEMKDPDIIPARNSVNDSGYEDFAEEQSRRKKNNDAPYEALPNTAKLLTQNNSNGNVQKPNKLTEEVAYAELSLPPNNRTNNDKIRRQERPTEYATIDFHKKSKPMSPNSSFTNQDESDTSADTPLMSSKLESTV